MKQTDLSSDEKNIVYLRCSDFRCYDDMDAEQSAQWTCPAAKVQAVGSMETVNTKYTLLTVRQ